MHSVKHGYLSHCFKSRTRDLGHTPLGSFLIHYVVLAAVDLTKKTRKNVDQRRNYGPKSKSKMAAVRHLGFVSSSYRTTHKVLSLGHIGLSNFMLIRCIVLKIWRFEFFADLAWNAYSHPKILVFGAKIGEGIFEFRPQSNQFFRFRPERFLPNFVKIGWKMRP